MAPFNFAAQKEFPSTSTSSASSIVEKQPAAAPNTTPAPPLKINIFRRAFGRFLRPTAAEVAYFQPTRAAPHCILPLRSDITTTVTKVRLHTAHCSYVKATIADEQVLCMRVCVLVTVRACCCGPDGREIAATQTVSPWVLKEASVRFTNGRESSIATATVQATETAAARSYEASVAAATAVAVAKVEKKFATKASRVLYCNK